MNLRRIARHLGTHHRTISLWVQAYPATLPKASVPETVETVAFSTDGCYLATGSYDKIARVWDITTGNEIDRISHHGDVYWVAFSQDGK